MFNGTHLVVFSEDPEADRALFARLFPGDPVDAGEGWLIFKTPPAEIAVHPPHGTIRHEIHLMCDDIEVTRAALDALGLACDAIEDMGYGLVSAFTLPGGARMGFYQPRHATALQT